VCRRTKEQAVSQSASGCPEKQGLRTSKALRARLRILETILADGEDAPVDATVRLIATVQVNASVLLGGKG